MIAALLLLTLLSTAYSQQTGQLYNLPDSRVWIATSSSAALANGGQLIVAANMLNNTVSFVRAFAAELDVEVPVGRDPRSVAVTPDSTRALVVNRGDGTLTVLEIVTRSVIQTIPVGILPYGVVPIDNTRALVSLEGENALVIVDITSGTITERIDTPPSPAGLAVWGDLVYITHLWSGRFSLVHLPQRRVVDSIGFEGNITLSQAIGLDVLRGTAYLPQTRLNNTADSPTYDARVFPVVNVVDLELMGRRAPQRIALDIADRPVNMPFAAVVDQERRWLYVANAGSNDISVIDLTTNLAVANIKVSSNPRGLLLTANAGTLYVHNMIEGTISVIDTSRLEVVDIIPISSLSIPADVYVGAQLFHSAADPRLTTGGWLSCASCHFEGRAGGLVWEDYNGQRQDTPLLYRLGETAPYNHRGTWDELADIEHKIRSLHAGLGLIEDGDPFPPQGDPNGGRALDLDTLGAYLLTLDGPPQPAARDTQAVTRGAELFNALNCADCHAGEIFTNGQRYDVGTGGEFDTPSLRWLTYSAPYLHDGSVTALEDLFIMPGAHRLIDTRPLDEIRDLVKYLESLPAP